MRKFWWSAHSLSRLIVTAGCVFLGLASRMAAQGTQGNIARWEGTVFTPVAERVTQNESSVLLTTLRTEATYDSNLLSSSVAQLSSTYTKLEGQAQYSLQHPTESLLLTYVGGIRIYPQYSKLNTSMQDARLQWQSQFSTRSKFTVMGRWADLPEGEVLEGNPNQLFSLIGSSDFSANFLKQRLEMVEGSFSYAYDLSKHTSLIIGGNYNSLQSYGLSLSKTRGEDAYGGWYYRPTPRQSVGLMYAHQWLYFSQGLGSSQVDNLLLTYSNKFTHNLSLSAFGGPARVQLTPGIGSMSTSASNSPPQTNLVTTQEGIVGGGNLAVSVGHYKVRVGYTSLVSSGSGFLTTVLRQTVDARFSRTFARRVEFSLVGAYTNNHQLGATSSGFRTYYVEPSIHYDLTRRLRLSLKDSYGQVLGLPQFGSVARNQVTTQLEYRFQEIPFGR